MNKKGNNHVAGNMEGIQIIPIAYSCHVLAINKLEEDETQCKALATNAGLINWFITWISNQQIYIIWKEETMQTCRRQKVMNN